MSRKRADVSRRYFFIKTSRPLKVIEKNVLNIGSFLNENTIRSLSMKHLKWQLAVAVSLVVLSTLLYILHYAIFKDSHHIYSYVLTDLAFLPIEVLIVSMIIDKLIGIRETRERLEKLNMVIGVFFSEIGTSLLGRLSGYDTNHAKLASKNESGEGLAALGDKLKNHEYVIDIDRAELKELNDFLAGRREFLLRVLENPTMLEHESFTDLLWAVFHLMEELSHRADFSTLPETDLHHLQGDIKRVYGELVTQWLAYMKHLEENYKFLFSLALRTNPFDKSASAVVKS